MKQKKVCDCGKKLTKDEIAVCKKLLGVDTEEFYCLPCLAEYLGCTTEDLEDKISEFKEQGCTLFI